MPEIDNELRRTRALSQLAHALLDAAVDDMSGVLHQEITLTR